MSLSTLEKKAYLASAIARLADAASATVIITGNPFWALLTILIGTVGRELAGYYKLQILPKDEPKP